MVLVHSINRITALDVNYFNGHVNIGRDPTRFARRYRFCSRSSSSDPAPAPLPAVPIHAGERPNSQDNDLFIRPIIEKQSYYIGIALHSFTKKAKSRAQ